MSSFFGSANNECAGSIPGSEHCSFLEDEYGALVG
jgi:hypothetical protein